MGHHVCISSGYLREDDEGRVVHALLGGHADIAGGRLAHIRHNRVGGELRGVGPEGVFLEIVERITVRVGAHPPDRGLLRRIVDDDGPPVRNRPCDVGIRNGRQRLLGEDRSGEREPGANQRAGEHAGNPPKGV